MADKVAALQALTPKGQWWSINSAKDSKMINLILTGERNGK